MPQHQPPERTLIPGLSFESECSQDLCWKPQITTEPHEKKKEPQSRGHVLFPKAEVFDCQRRTFSSAWVFGKHPSQLLIPVQVVNQEAGDCPGDACIRTASTTVKTQAGNTWSEWGGSHWKSRTLRWKIMQWNAVVLDSLKINRSGILWP